MTNTSGEEPTLVLKDENGDYYLIPMKHMPINKVDPGQVDRLQETLTAVGAEDLNAIAAGGHIGFKTAPEFLAIHPVGVVALPIDVRRQFTEPSLRDIIEFPSPPS